MSFFRGGRSCTIIPNSEGGFTSFLVVYSLGNSLISSEGMSGEESVESVRSRALDNFLAPLFSSWGVRYLGWMCVIRWSSMAFWGKMRLHWAHLMPMSWARGVFMTDRMELARAWFFYGVRTSWLWFMSCLGEKKLIPLIILISIILCNDNKRKFNKRDGINFIWSNRYYYY